MNLIKYFLILSSLISSLAQARLIQIIHTNDLHSYFEGARPGLGGYARIKTLVDQLKKDAADKNIPTLFLDGGDFGEGSSYYFSNNGIDALRGLDLLGIDVTVLGNHDFILGGRELSRQISDARLKATMLSANLRGRAAMGLLNKIKPYIDYNIDGLKIRIFGLTTPEVHFQYPLLPNGFIAPSHNTGIKMAEKAQRDEVDFLIALTHIGLDKDMTLASHTFSLNMIIGGHSHTRLDQPKMIENLHGDLVPVFQTGAHGLAVGSVIIDVLGDGEAKFIDYRLYDVSKDIPEDDEVKAFVEEAYVNRERYFNRSWDEVIGFSEIPLTGSYLGRIRNPRSCWSRHIARLTKDTAQTQIGLQLDIFQGEEIPAGPIRFGDLIDNFPHFREWGDKGWNISRAKISGLILNQVLKYLGSGKEPFHATLDGVQAYDAKKRSYVPFVLKQHSLDEALIDGVPIKNTKFYTIGFPNEVAYALGKMSGLIRNLLLMNAETVTDSYYWPLVEDYLRKNSPLKCLED
jgi:2',3'-cyclic-nucleotide 2'-phosphodiesterase (5'-nucleotidase family)